MVIDDKSYTKTTSNSNPISKTKKTDSKKEEKTKSNNQNTTNTKIMSYENTLNAMKEKAASADALGSILKLNFGENQIIIDGTNGANVVSGDDAEANCTVDVSLEDFTAMVKGELNPMGAFMAGKMKVKGDTGIALKLQSLMG
jgi:putative sterol carrier protein